MLSLEKCIIEVIKKVIASSGFLNDCPVHSPTGVRVSLYSLDSSSDGDCNCDPEEILYGDIFLTMDESLLEWDADEMSEWIEKKKEEKKKEEDDWVPLNRKDRRSKRGREYLMKANNVEL